MTFRNKYLSKSKQNVLSRNVIVLFKSILRLHVPLRHSKIISNHHDISQLLVMGKKLQIAAETTHRIQSISPVHWERYVRLCIWHILHRMHIPKICKQVSQTYNNNLKNILVSAWRVTEYSDTRKFQYWLICGCGGPQEISENDESYLISQSPKRYASASKRFIARNLFL